MAEVFGVASSAIGVCGVAGQLAKGCMSLRDIIQDIKDAPERMLKMAEELDLTSNIFNKIYQSAAKDNKSEEGEDIEIEDPVLHRTVKFCLDAMGKAEEYVRNNNPNLHSRRYKRYWVQVSSAFKKSDMDGLLGSLERCKSLLQQAYTHSVAERHDSRLQAIDRSLTSLSTMQEYGHADISREFRGMRNEFTESRTSTASQVSRTTTEDWGSDTSDRPLTNTQLAASLAAATTVLSEKIGSSKHEVIDKFNSLEIRMDYLEQTVSTADLLGPPPPYRRTLKPRPRAHLLPSAGFAAENDTDDDVIELPRRRQPPKGEWNKMSTKSEQYTTQNMLLGSLSVQETTVTYTREPLETDYYNTPHKRQDVKRKLTYLLPSWLSPSGVSLSKAQQLFFLDRGQRLTSPSWGIRSVNVRSKDDEIFYACMDLDLHKVHHLFDTGLASPYDVDEEGRNCMYFVSGYPRHDAGESNSRFQEQVKDAESLTDLLVKMGVDAGGKEQDGHTPAMSFLHTYCGTSVYSISSPLDRDHAIFLFKKLSKMARTNPFAGFEMLISLSMTGRCCYMHFPKSLRAYSGSFPLSIGYWLLNQQEWEIQWHPDQLADICCPRLFWWESHPLNFVFDVGWWVDTSAPEMLEPMQDKIEFLAEILKLDICRHTREQSVVHALRVTMEQGGVIFSMLARSQYKKTGRLAWVRDRFRKLVILRAYLTVVFRLLLRYGSTTGGIQPLVFVDFLAFGERQGLRVSSAYVEAFAAVFLVRQRQQRQQSQGPSSPKKSRLRRQSHRASTVSPTRAASRKDSRPNNDGWNTDDEEIASDSDSDSDSDDTGYPTESEQSSSDEEEDTEAYKHQRTDVLGNEADLTRDYQEKGQVRSLLAYFYRPRCACLRRESPYSACAIRTRHVNEDGKPLAQSVRRLYVRPKTNARKTDKHDETGARQQDRRAKTSKKKRRQNRYQQRNPPKKEKPIRPFEEYKVDGDWETEDEWESGYRLDCAVDTMRADINPPPMDKKQRYDEHDEDYWMASYAKFPTSKALALENTYNEDLF